MVWRMHPTTQQGKSPTNKVALNSKGIDRPRVCMGGAVAETLGCWFVQPLIWNKHRRTLNIAQQLIWSARCKWQGCQILSYFRGSGSLRCTHTASIMSSEATRLYVCRSCGVQNGAKCMRQKKYPTGHKNYPTRCATGHPNCTGRLDGVYILATFLTLAKITQQAHKIPQQRLQQVTQMYVWRCTCVQRDVGLCAVYLC